MIGLPQTSWDGNAPVLSDTSLSGVAAGGSGGSMNLQRAPSPSDNEKYKNKKFSEKMCEQWDCNLQHRMCFSCRLHRA